MLIHFCAVRRALSAAAVVSDGFWLDDFALRKTQKEKMSIFAFKCRCETNCVSVSNYPQKAFACLVDPLEGV